MWKPLKFLLAFFIVPVAPALIYISSLKLPLTLKTPYYVFPFLPSEIISESSPLFLFTHTLLGVILLSFTLTEIILDVTNTDQKFKERLNKYRFYLNILFILIILSNFWRLGNTPILHAILINLLGIILSASFCKNPYIYFIIISLPSLIELYLLTKLFLECIITNITSNNIHFIGKYIFSSKTCLFLQTYH